MEPGGDRGVDSIMSMSATGEGRFVLGFGLFHGWLITMLMYSGMPFLGGVGPLSTGLFLVGGMAAAAAYTCASDSLMKRLFAVRDALLVLSSCSVLVVLAMPSEYAFFGCCLVGGLLCGSLHCSYGLASLAFPKRDCVRLISLATIVASSVASVSILVGESFGPLWQAMVLIVLQLSSGIMLKDVVGRSAGCGKAVVVGKGRGGKEAGRFLRLMLAVLLFGIVSRTCDVFTSSNYTGQTVSSLALFASHVAAAVLMMVLARSVAQRRELSFFYRFALPCAGAGFVVLASPMGLDLHVSLAAIVLVGLGYEVINLTAWVLTTYAAQVSAQPARYFGLYALVTYLAMMTGKAFGFGLMPFASASTAFVGLVCVVVLVVIALVVLPEDQVCLFEGSLRVSEEERAEGEAFAARSRAFSEAYGLTERESEVLELLARGRTLKVVAERLTISKGTAGTHIANIYRKADVHKQQDLIDLFESFSR